MDDSSKSGVLEEMEAWLCSDLLNYTRDDRNLREARDNGFRCTRFVAEVKDRIVEMSFFDADGRNYQILAICSVVEMPLQEASYAPDEEVEFEIEVDEALEAVTGVLEPYFSNLVARLATKGWGEFERCQIDYLSTGKSVCVAYVDGSKATKVAFDLLISEI